jgi:hypothetical protein
MAYLSTVASSNLDFQNFFSAKLTSSLTASDTDIPMDTIPSISEGVLVIDWDVAASREVIFFNSKTASKVVCPSVANGRGFDGSTATTHASGANVIMAPVADYFRYIKYIATTSTAAWKPLGYTPNTVTNNGNRSVTMVFNSVDLTTFISNGMKLKVTRTVTAPTQCTSLNGTTQYYSKAAPAGMAQTDDLTGMAWIKPNSYALGGIVSRNNGTTDGWKMYLNATGQVVFTGARAADDSVTSYQSVVLNKWQHVAASVDSSGAVGVVCIDGLSVPASYGNNANSAFAAPTQSFLVGATNGAAPTDFFPGKIAQAAVFSINLGSMTVATLRTYISQGLAGTETSLISAYSFNNSINDLNANANNLTANGSAVATNADSPFGQDDNATTLGTTDWGVVTSKVFSTNTTITVQMPEGSMIPTSGGISAMFYSTEKTPYGFPTQVDRWEVLTVLRQSTSSAAASWVNVNGGQLQVPAGTWQVSYHATYSATRTATSFVESKITLSDASTTESDKQMTGYCYNGDTGGTTVKLFYSVTRFRHETLAALATKYLNINSTAVNITVNLETVSDCIMRAMFAYV